MDEEEFLQRIRRRLTPGEPPAHPGPLTGPARTLPVDLLGEFEQRLTRVGGQVHRPDGVIATRLLVRDIITGRNSRHAILSDHAPLRELELEGLLTRLGLVVTAVSAEREISPAALKEIAAGADVGLTGAEYAIAASGTLVLAASAGHPRSVSLLPPLHLAFLRPEQLLPDLAALVAALRRDYPAGLPSGLALVTGPSRTADIEQTLSIGVHGPGELHVIVLDGF
jgi:L-lactate dehydrogenase complex protein LldG